MFAKVGRDGSLLSHCLPWQDPTCQGGWLETSLTGKLLEDFSSKLIFFFSRAVAHLHPHCSTLEDVSITWFLKAQLNSSKSDEMLLQNVIHSPGKMWSIPGNGALNSVHSFPYRPFSSLSKQGSALWCSFQLFLFVARPAFSETLKLNLFFLLPSGNVIGFFLVCLFVLIRHVTF